MVKYAGGAYKAVAGEGVGKSIKNTYDAVATKKPSDDVEKYAGGAYKAVTGEGVGKSIKNTYDAIATKKPGDDVEKYAGAAYRAVAGEEGVGESIKNTYDAVATKNPVDDVFTHMGKAYDATAGNKTPGKAIKDSYESLSTKDGAITATRNAYKKMTDSVSIEDTAKSVYEAVGGDAKVSDKFNAVNRHELFGSEPWKDQKVAENFAKFVAGYTTVDEGVEKVKQNYEDTRKYTDLAVTGSTGFGAGLGGAAVGIIPYMLYGAGTGFQQSGIPGLLAGLGKGFISAITLPFRNAHNNSIPGEENKAKGLEGMWRLMKKDWENVAVGWQEYDPWVVEKDNRYATAVASAAQSPAYGAADTGNSPKDDSKFDGGEAAQKKPAPMPLNDTTSNTDANLKSPVKPSASAAEDNKQGEIHDNGQRAPSDDSNVYPLLVTSPVSTFSNSENAKSNKPEQIDNRKRHLDETSRKQLGGSISIFGSNRAGSVATSNDNKSVDDAAAEKDQVSNNPNQ